MKILLVAINAKYIHTNLAIYNLKIYCKKYSEQIELVEYTINQYSEDILADIFKRNPDIIAMSSYIWNIQMVKEIAGDLHKILRQVPIWLGGPEVSYDAASFLREVEAISGIIVGEGEHTFYELLRYYIDHQGSLADIQGLVYRESSGGIVSNPAREVMDLNLIPFAYEKIPLLQSQIVYYESSRGCPFSCSYCLSSLDKKLRFRDIQIVKEELSIFLAQKVPQVKFVDRTFNCNREHALEIWRFLQEQDNGITNFHFEIGADLLGEEELKLFADMRPGLIQLEIGIQSVNAKTINEIRRIMDFEKSKQVIKRIQKYDNIHQHLDLIAGLPYEDYESFRQSFAKVYELRPDQLQLGFLKVLKGSYMHEMAEQYGIVYRQEPPYEVLFTKWIGYGQMLRLKAVEEMVEIYYNSRQFVHTLEYFVKEYENPFDFYFGLAQYYERFGFIGTSQARLSRYEILREFLLEKPDRKEILINEILTLDLYAREKVKSRPNWAADLTEYKELIYEFYKREEQDRQYLQGYESYNYKQLKKLTHIEVFTHLNIPFYAEEMPGVLLFDYKNRNTKCKDAKIIPITL